MLKTLRGMSLCFRKPSVCLRQGISVKKMRGESLAKCC